MRMRRAAERRADAAEARERDKDVRIAVLEQANAKLEAERDAQCARVEVQSDPSVRLTADTQRRGARR